MPPPGETRPHRRLVGPLAVAVAVGVLGLMGVASPSYAGDDYPYAGLGQCPLVPLPHPPKSGPTKPGAPHHPGQHPTKPHRPGRPGKPGGPHQPPKTPPPPRPCAKHIWFYQGTYGDPWGFALRNCTSFVAWRLRETNGVTDFSNHLAGGTWGNAQHWDANARALGYLVDDVPAVGAVAQTDDGRIGHVAWVSAVGDGTVTVEEYNYDVAGGYDVRTVPTSDFRYLHVADVAPAPDLGSTRAAATALDARRGTWTARTSAGGDLTVRRPSGTVDRIGGPGTWSPYAAPSVVVDTLGRVWVAAVTRDGRLLVTHAAVSRGRWSAPAAIGRGGWSTTSTPRLAVDAQSRVRLVSVTATGDLVERRTTTTRSVRWSRGTRLGLRGSWSTQSSPAVTTDGSGRLLLVAVTRGGRLLARHTDVGGTHWKAFHPVDHRTWSVTSSPALSGTSDGRLWLAAVTAQGGLVLRSTGPTSARWRHPHTVAGTWSPYSSPAIAPDGAGRLWWAAMADDGSLVVRSTTSDLLHWRAAHTLGPDAWSPTGSPALATSSSGDMQVGAVTTAGRTLWRRAAGRGSLLDRAPSARAGAFAASASLGLPS